MQLDRNFLSQIIITLAVCIGGWMMFVEPRVDELHDLEQAIAETEAHPMRTNQKTLRTLANRVEAFKERVRTVEFQNAFARDSSQMYGRIMAVAKSYDVSVQRLDPGSDDDDRKDKGPIRTTTFDMTVQGQYPQVAKFLEAIDDLEGFVRPRTLNLTPRALDGKLIVEARFICDAIAFELPDALAAMTEGAGDAVD